MENDYELRTDLDNYSKKQLIKMYENLFQEYNELLFELEHKNTKIENLQIEIGYLI